MRRTRTTVELGPVRGVLYFAVIAAPLVGLVLLDFLLRRRAADTRSDGSPRL